MLVVGEHLIALKETVEQNRVQRSKSLRIGESIDLCTDQLLGYAEAKRVISIRPHASVHEQLPLPKIPNHSRNTEWIDDCLLSRPLSRKRLIQTATAFDVTPTRPRDEVSLVWPQCVKCHLGLLPESSNSLRNRPVGRRLAFR